MKKLFCIAVLNLPLIGGAAAAQDNWRCDCTSVISSCRAEVQVKGNWVEVQTDTEACARVDYLIDGLPFVALVIDGNQRQASQGRSGKAEVLVQSCQVCQQAAEAQPDAIVPSVSDSGSDTDLKPLIKVTPHYPDRARLNRIQGKVEVEFTVTADGTVENPRVLSATPRRTFEQAAIAAVKRWRYPPREAGAQPVTLREQIDFALDGINPSSSTGRKVSTRPRPVNRPRNECIRESTSYDFGDRVEVGLINACQVPVVVYACGIGTGNNLGRWICHTPERTGTALIRRDIDAMDRKIGAGYDLRYVQDQFLVRAPNSQYWWIACEPSDDNCRAAGQEWTSDIQRAPATVDPQKAARINLARSR
jgi:TonB family protein